MTNCLSMFDHFVGLALKGLGKPWQWSELAQNENSKSMPYQMTRSKETVKQENVEYLKKWTCSFQSNTYITHLFPMHFLYPLKTSENRKGTNG